MTADFTTTDGSRMTASDARSTEVESLPVLVTVGYETDPKKIRDDEEQDISK